MKYVSIWNNDNQTNKSNNYSQWIPFTDNRNHSIIIMSNYANYRGMHVFDLNVFQFIKHDILPINNYIGYHCFILNSENGQREENKQNSHVVVLSKYRLSIEYNEDNNTFRFCQLSVCHDSVYSQLVHKRQSYTHYEGEDDKKTIASIHMKTKVRMWDPLLLVMICLFLFDETQINYIM
ncbi:hypothetical protein RFI_15940 [Reticulomyxa filosa]|uniref:Uncharacterized protein n=1 Tax=Reticulomyxa filosa TaxID=46433 RepID=X6N674_RETFI|nr:hypothetical protein RFI_15940 [Reticulomyxa filosa]|eukprot:ETO21264.1 hypothetical protein RFI_15940 [Reticulomyxa filosa]